MADKDEQLLGYCGIYCPDCFMYKGNIADLARDLRKVLREEKFEKIASGSPFIKGYKECYQTLGNWVKLRCKRACKNGGGNPMCKIRICAQKSGFTTCAECGTFLTCNKLAKLTAMHGGDDAHINNLKSIKKSGSGKLLGKREMNQEIGLQNQS